MRKLEELKDIIDTNLNKLDISAEAKEDIIQRTVIEKKKAKSRRFKFLSIPAVAAVIVFFIIFSNIFGGNTETVANAQDLMKGITPAKVKSVEVKDDFIKSQADFSIGLFKNSIKNGENSVISPLSVYLALAMTANGSNGNTLKEFESVLGKYNTSMEDVNKYCYSYANNLRDIKSGKLNISNSIWYALGGINVNKKFLQTNADYYGASAYMYDFNSPKTVDSMNKWVKTNTGNLIDKIIDKIDKDAVMYLINTIYFEADWQSQYNKEQIKQGDFKLADGGKVITDFMYSTENGYIKDEQVQGFVKPYKDNKYSFVALLPNEGVNIDDYVSSLTGEKLLSLIKNKTDESVEASLPKFKYEYGLSLVETLKAMGLKDCFNPETADFSKMNSSNEKNLFISDVKHKAFIQVDGLGTKAGAVTSVEIQKTAILVTQNKVILDRPFIYAIIDNETGLPLFMGTMNNPQK